ncbi:hypothetical protein HDU96_004383 [Phlyctochytrium bullatum]|nr:hypothetical protein HDU96_004383 [Phlyctochytrium bullatum]
MKKRPRVYASANVTAAVARSPSPLAALAAAAAHPSSSSSSSSSATLNPNSPFHIGRNLELRVQQRLHALRFRLALVGGANDQGIDLRGHWHLPSSPSSSGTSNDIPNTTPAALVQCKNEKSPLGPRHVREFEGVLVRASPPPSSAPSTSLHTVGILASRQGFSDKARTLFHGSQFPMMLLTEWWMDMPDGEEELKRFDLCMNLSLKNAMPGLMISRVLGGTNPDAQDVSVFFHGIRLDSRDQKV